MSRHPVFTVGLLLLCLVFCRVAWFKVDAYRAYQLVRQSDPLQQAAKMRGVPVLLLHGDADDVVPLSQHSAHLKDAVGTSCALVSIPRAGHGNERCFDTPRILAFLRQHATKQTPIILIHGWGTDASDWQAYNATHLYPNHSRVACATALQQAGYKTLTGEFAGNAWGNESAYREFEKLVSPYPRVVLLGESMGGLLMWRYAEAHPDHVACGIGIYPVCSTTAMLQSRFKEDIERAYSP